MTSGAETRDLRDRLPRVVSPFVNQFHVSSAFAYFPLYIFVVESLAVVARRKFALIGCGNRSTSVIRIQIS